MMNRQAWEGLTKEEQATIQSAIEAEAWQQFADFNARNAEALTQLIDTHGVQLRRYSDDLLVQVGRVAEAVVAENGESDELTRQVYESYLAFR
jgi:TRAP-type mannitol/chloroaromatic compound transport system substrate-binding protein